MRDLIKGKITEVIFEEMFRLSEEFIILPLGYEHSTPLLAQYQHHIGIKSVLENIRNAPVLLLFLKIKQKFSLLRLSIEVNLVKKMF